MTVIQSDIRPAIRFASSFCHRRRRQLLVPGTVMFRQSLLSRSLSVTARFGAARAFSTETEESSSPSITNVEVVSKPPICTADELHYVSVNKSQWRLSLWRYTPPPEVCNSLNEMQFFFSCFLIVLRMVEW